MYCTLHGFEIFTAFPAVILVLIVQGVLPAPNLTSSLLLTISLTRWTEPARLVRAEVLTIESQDYITAARALGGSPFRILVRHIAQCDCPLVRRVHVQHGVRYFDRVDRCVSPRWLTAARRIVG